MKKISTAAACLSFFLNVSAQEAPPPFKWIFKMSPQHLVLNMLKVESEFFNRPKSRSYQASVQVVSNNDGKGYHCCAFPYNGIGAEFGMRRYILPLQETTTKKGRQLTHGIYLSGFIQGGTYRGDFKGVDSHHDFQTGIRTDVPYEFSTRINNAAIGFTIGLQRIFWRVLSLDAYVGAGYQGNRATINGNQPDGYGYAEIGAPNYDGVLPKIGLSLGLAL